jgi:hypothetical protein
MSQPRGFGLNGKSIYKNIVKPMEIDCNFVVDSTNGNGLGIRSLKSNGYIQNVFMHTSATPGSNNGTLNPNPSAGTMIVQFNNNFNYYLGGYSGEIVSLTSTTTTSTTNHSPYAITSLGTTTLAQWQAAGLPLGFTPAVGAGFVAKATGSIGGSGTVGVPGVPLPLSFMPVGDPNQTLANSSVAQNGGAQIVFQIFAPTNSSTTTLVATNPADNSVLSFQFTFDGSVVTVDGL